MNNFPILKVGHQGVSGSFSEQALFNYFPNDVEVVQCESFEDVFKAIDQHDIHYGVVPIENSSTGAINTVYDLLTTYECHIVGETYVAAIQNLLGIKGTTLENIVTVYSHPQGFEQSTTFLAPYPWLLVPYYNTARSAELVKEKQDPTVAAIASKQAAQIYGLEILAENINCNKHNTTRFIIISKSFKPNQLCNKVSVVFSTKHKAGALFHALEHFAKHQVNLLKIESRPVKHTNWEYYFYLDFEGNINDTTIATTLDEMAHACDYFKLLGNYRAMQPPKSD